MTRRRAPMLCLTGCTCLGLLSGASMVQSGVLAGESQPQVATATIGTLQWTTAPSLPDGAVLAVVYGNPQGTGPLTVRLKFPANYQVPPHTHPVTENVTVLSGALHIGLGTKLEKEGGSTLPVGGFVRFPAGTPHYAWTTEETIIQLHSTQGPWAVEYVDPQDDPRHKPS